MAVKISDCSDFHIKYLELAREYYELNLKRKEIEETLKSLKIAISTHLKEDKLTIIEVEPYKVMLSEVKAMRLNITKIKNNDPELYQKYLTESKYEKLIITLNQEIK